MAEEEEKTNQTLITEDTITKMMAMLFNGLLYLHNKHVCHRDIKPSNIYITKDLEQLKILDFNVALKYNLD